MNKISLTLILLCTAFSAILHAEAPGKDHPLEKYRAALVSGEIKLAKTASASSAWTRTLKSSSGAKQGILKTISAVRLGDTKREVHKSPDGSQVEYWEIKDYYIFQPTPGSRIEVAEKRTMMAESQQMFADFPGTSWAGPENLVAIEKRGPKTLLKFEGTVKVGAPRTPEEIAVGKVPLMIEVPQNVWFDASTGLPVEMRQSDYTHTYEFYPPPATVPALPQDFRSALDGHLRAMQIMNKRLNSN